MTRLTGSWAGRGQVDGKRPNRGFDASDRFLARDPNATTDGRTRSHPLIRRCYVSRAGPLISPSLKDRERSFATARIRLPQITPSLRGRPSAAAALAGNIWAGSPWRATG